MKPIQPMAALCLLVAVLLAGCGTAPPAPVSEPITIGVDASGQVLTLSGQVSSIDNGCFADGECSVSVNGLKVVTLRGWSRAIWGTRDVNLALGDRVDVRCRATDGGCTLEGSDEYFVRKAR